MKRHSLTRAFYSLLLSLSLPLGAQASEWLVLNPLGIDFLASYDARITKSEDQERILRSILDTGVALIQSGYILDPGIVSFDVTLEPTYTNALVSGQGLDSKLSDTNLNYNIALRLLQEAKLPLTAVLRATRSAVSTNGVLGSFSRSRIQEQSAHVTWRNTFFPATLRYLARSSQRFYVSGLNQVVTSQDYDIRSLSLRASSSPMQLRMEAFQADDLLTDNDFDRFTGNLRHLFKWGKDSYLRSTLDYINRTGYIGFEQRRWDEVLHIIHGNNFYSHSSFTQTTNEQDTKTTVNTARFELVHSAYQNLDTSIYLQGDSIENTNYDQRENQIGLRAQYNKNNFFGTNSSANFSIYHGNTDLDSRSGLIEVVDESHVVPLSGDILLNRRYAILGSIIITDYSGVQVYAEGIDYELSPQPEGFTLILIIPGGRISVGQVILVSYSAATLPSSEYSTLGINAGVNIFFKGFQFSYYINKRDYNLISGTPVGFLDDYTDSRISLGYIHDFSQATASLRAEYRNVNTGEFDSQTIAFEQDFTYTISPRVDGKLHMLEMIQGLGTDVESKSYAMELSFDWKPRFGLHLVPEIGYWQRKDDRAIEGSGQSTTNEKYLTAGLGIRWVYRQIFADLVFRHNKRGINNSNSNYNIVHLNLRRRFR